MTVTLFNDDSPVLLEGLSLIASIDSVPLIHPQVSLAGIGFGLRCIFESLQIAAFCFPGVGFEGGAERFGGIGVCALGGGELGPGLPANEQVDEMFMPGKDGENVVIG